MLSWRHYLNRLPSVRANECLPHVAVMLCFFCSGFLALAYEICWIRKASLVFGSTNYALSTVLAVFFGGLAAGSWLFGRIAQRTVRPMLWYGLVEIAAGALAALSPFSFDCMEKCFGYFYPALQHNFAALSAVRFAMLVTLLAPTAICMGGTLPLFCRQFVNESKSVVRWVGWLYAVNTLGAAVGALTCGFFLMRQFGMTVTLVAGGLLNVLIGWLALWLSSKVCHPGGIRSQLNSQPVSPQVGRGRLMPLYGIVFLIGFVGLANEVLWTRYLSLLFHSTVYTYTLTLTVVLIGIVVGSLVSATVFPGVRRRALALGFIQIVNGLVVSAVLLSPPTIWERWRDVDQPMGQVWVITLVLLVPAILSGTSFPLAIELVTRDSRQCSANVGRMTAVNTCGGILGSMAIGFVILPNFGLQASLMICSGVSVLAGLCAITWLATSTLMREKCLLAVAGVALWLAVPTIAGTRLPEDWLSGEGQLAEVREGINSNLAVVVGAEGRRLEVDRLWQGEDRKTHQIMAAHLPMLFHEKPEDVLVVGIGVGQTASRFLMYPIRSLHCVDIECELVPMMQRHFDAGWLEDPRVRVIIDDGRNYLTHVARRYDVISIEVGQTFRPGVASFYTEEFYRRARERLAPSGTLAQFVSLDFLGPDEFTSAVRTFLNVFPQSTLWYNRSELLLIGSKDHNAPQIRPAQLERIATDAAISRDLEFSYWGGKQRWLNRQDHLLAGFLMGPAGLAQLAAGAPIYYDDPPRLEYSVSTHHAANHAHVVEFIQACLEPVQRVLAESLECPIRQRIAAGRQTNLKNILANDLLWRARKYAVIGEFKQASQLAAEARRQNPRNYEANLILGDLSVALQHHGQALTHYRNAIAIRPSSGPGHRGIANCLWKLGKFDEARKHFGTFLQLRQDNRSQLASGRSETDEGVVQQ